MIHKPFYSEIFRLIFRYSSLCVLSYKTYLSSAKNIAKKSDDLFGISKHIMAKENIVICLWQKMSLLLLDLS